MPNPDRVVAPRGMHAARVDDKGRLKLPAALQKYLTDLGESQVFVTSVDGRIARIYPTSVWKENEKLQDGPADDPGSMEAVAFLANYFGADSEIDGQGRILLHPELRRPLGLENEQVFLNVYKGRIDVLSKAIVEERKAQALAGIENKLRSVEAKGFR